MFSTTVATLAEFRALGTVWNQLLLSMEYPIVFLTWEWIYTWWEHFGASDREPVILVVSEGEHVRGILPLYAESAIFRDYWLSGRVLTHCSATDLFPDHVDLIAAPGHAGQCLDSILEFLGSQYRAWDVLQIPMVASSSQLMEWLHGAGKRALPAGLDIEPASHAYFIRIDGTFEDYLSRLDTKHRYNVRSRTKKLRERQDVRYASGDYDQLACLRRLFALHRQRAARRGIVSSFVDPRVHSFHEAFATRVADFGWVSLRELRRPDGVIASSYNFDFGGRIFSYQKGFDPEYERYGPGSVLMFELIREAFSLQRLEYNFLQGDEAYKREWTQDRRILSNVTIYNKTARGYASRGGFRLKQRAKRGLGIHGPVDQGVRCTVEVAGVEVLRTCGTEWSALVDSMRYPTVFSSWEWIWSWWQHFGAGRELHLLMVRREGRLVAVLPLFSEAQYLGSHGRMGRVLEYAGAVELYPDPLDIISAEADAGECVEAVMQFLQVTAGDWDVAHFRYLAEGSDLLRGVSGASVKVSPAERISAAPYIPIAGNYEEYLKGLSPNERAKVRRCRRKLVDGEGAVYRDLGSADPQQGLRTVFDLHERRAAEKGIRSAFAGEDVKAFHLDLVKRLNPQQLWLRGLVRGDAVIAAFYGFSTGGRISYYQLGYDPAWSGFSPGAVLLQETIREAFDGGAIEYNFLQGDEEFKYRLTHHARQLFAVDLFSRSLFGRLSSWATGTKRRLKARGVATTQQ